MKKILSKLSIIFLSALLLHGCSSSGPSIRTDDPEKAFRIAKRNFDKGNYIDAIEDFSFLKVKFPGTSISDRVQFYLSESYFKREEYLLAAYEYETLIKNYTLSPLQPEARYKLGLCYYELSPKYSLDQEFTKYAITELLNFIELFPSDRNAPDAEKKLKELRNKLAYKDYRTGELYLKMDNYRSAAVYFKNTYENYIDSEWADDAMVGHAEALFNRANYQEAMQVLDKFYKLFPKSSLRPKAEKLKKKFL